MCKNNCCCGCSRYDKCNKEFLESIKGEKGEKGEQGRQGLPGVPGSKGIQGIPGAVGLTGAQGIQGERGIQGQTGEPGKDGTSIPPNLYHADLSTAGKQIEIPLAFLTPPTGSPRVTIKLAYATPETVSIALKATGNPVTVDFFSLDNTKLSTNYVSAGEIMNQSNQSFHTWIRIKHPLDNTWWLYELTVSVSAKGARTDIWIIPLYENSAIEWK